MSNPMTDAMGRKQLDHGKTPWGAVSELRAALEAVPHKGDLWKHENPESICPGCAALVLLDWMGADDED